MTLRCGFVFLQSEVCTSALVDVVHAVINGNDGCVLCLGQSKTGQYAAGSHHTPRLCS